MKRFASLRRVCALCMVLTMLVGMVGCGGSAAQGAASNPAPAGSNTATPSSASAAAGPMTNLNVGINADIGDISPFGGVGTGRTYTKYTIYEYLLQFSEFGQTVEEMVRQVAKNVTVVDPTTCRIEIYNYVKDAAGNAINAEDVLFCYNKMLESKNLPKLNTYIEKIEKVDDYTLDFFFTNSKVGTMEYVFCQVPIISKAAFEASDNGMTTKPISTAPYQVTEMVAGSHLLLTKNANYWQTDASQRSYLSEQAFETIKMSVITEAAQMTIALQSGTIDAATVVGGKEIENFRDANGNATPGFSVLQQTGGVVYSLLFNTSSQSPFASKELRQAVCYAIDSAAVLQGASNGAGVICNTAASVISGDYNKEWDKQDYYNYNLDTAKAKMKEAGVNAGQISIRLMVENTAEYNKMAEIIQAYLLQLGVETQILSYDPALFNTYKGEPDQWDIRLTALGTSDFVVGAYDLGIGPALTGKYLNDPKLQELLSTAMQVSTHTAENVESIHAYIKDNAYAYGLYAQATTSVSSDRVQMVRHPWGQLIAGACKPAA